ncbi:unnamed protein product, partial [Pleuronectes platessa]
HNPHRVENKKKKMKAPLFHRAVRTSQPNASHRHRCAFGNKSHLVRAPVCSLPPPPPPAAGVASITSSRPRPPAQGIAEATVAWQPPHSRATRPLFSKPVSAHLKVWSRAGSGTERANQDSLRPLCALTDHITISESSSVRRGSYGPAKEVLGVNRASSDRESAAGGI